MRRAAVVIGLVFGAACAEPAAPLAAGASAAKVEAVAAKTAVVETPARVGVQCKACADGEGPRDGDDAVILAVRKLLAVCGGQGEMKWRVDYVLPGRKAYVPDQVFAGDRATKKCLSDQLSMFEWPAGYRAKVVAHSDVDRTMTEETLRPMNALYGELDRCRKDGGDGAYEFDLNVKDASGSTVANVMYRISVDEQACFLAAVAKLRPPQPWSMRLKLTRGDGPFDDPE